MSARRVSMTAELFDVDADRTGGLRAVDDAEDPFRTRQRRDLRDRHPKPGRREDMTNGDDLRLLRDRLCDQIQDLVLVEFTLRYRDLVDLRAVIFLKVLPA